MYMRKDGEMESSGLGLYSVFHVLMSKPKATDFHLCETESIYVVLRISLDVNNLLSFRSTLCVVWDRPQHQSDSCAIKSSTGFNIINYLRVQPCHM